MTEHFAREKLHVHLSISLKSLCRLKRPLTKKTEKNPIELQKITTKILVELKIFYDDMVICSDYISDGFFYFI